MHLPKLNFFFLLLFLCCSGTGKAQSAQGYERYNSFQFNVNEGLLQSHIDDIAIDKFNFAWLSFANGIQRFDGVGFTDIATQPGLPDDKYCSFYVLEDSSLLINHSFGLTKYNAEQGSFKLVFSYGQKQNTTSKIVGTDKNFLYILLFDGELLTLDKQHFSLVSRKKLLNYYTPSGKGYFLISDLLGDHFAVVSNDRITLFNVQSGKPIAESGKIENIYGTSITLFSSSVVGFFVNENEIVVEKYWDTKSNLVISKHRLDAPAVKPFRSAYLQTEKSIYQSYFNRLFKKSRHNIKLPNSEVVTLQNSPIANDAVIYKLKEDHFGKLYMLTINSGLLVVMPNIYELKYFGIEGYRQNFTTVVQVDKRNNRVYVGTFGNGLLIFDTLQHLQKHIKSLPGEQDLFTPIGVVPLAKNKYMIMCFGGKEGWVLKNDELVSKPIPIYNYAKGTINPINYYGNTIIDKNGKWWLETSPSLYDINEDKIIEYDTPSYLTMGGVFFKDEFVCFSYDRLVFIDLTTRKTRSYKVPNTGGVRCMAVRENTVCIGGNKGVFIVSGNGKMLKQYNKESGLPDECIYSIIIDKNNDLWCSSNRGIFKINQQGKITRLTKEDGLQENEFNTNVSTSADDGELYFGGVNGVTAFYPASIASFKPPGNIYFTAIKVNNKNYTRNATAIWNTNSLDLDYNENSLAFNFVAHSNSIPSQFVYQYKMEGVDKEWLQNDGLQTVRYYLAPGKYTFKVFASKLFNPGAKAMNSIHIVIAQPFWNTWWFRLLLGAIAVAIIYYLVSKEQKAKYRKKLDILAHENELKEEREKISKDLHDSIGAYANVVLYKTEMLQQEKNPLAFGQLVTELKFASKDIITSLRENIWALKQEEFSAEDCFLRIKSFLHAITRYYPQLNLKVKGEAPKDTTLYYRNALHVVRIVQEAVTNIIKHADATHVIVQSSENDLQWILQVTDDGKGFDAALAGIDDEGNGLINIRHRVQEAGFGYELITSPGNGTEVRISINKK